MNFYQDNLLLLFFFTLQGVLPLVIALICVIFVKNHPSQDENISRQELEYILRGTESSKERRVSIVSMSPLNGLLYYVHYFDNQSTITTTSFAG